MIETPYPATVVTSVAPNTLASNTPEQIGTVTQTGVTGNRAGMVVHNLSSSAVSIVLTIAPSGTAVDATYVQTTNYQHAVLAPGQTTTVMAGGSIDVWATAVSGTATVVVLEFA